MFVIDRIEEGFAILEQDGTLQNIPLTALPEGVREGDMLEQQGDSYVLCPEAAAMRRELLSKRRRKLLGGAP